MKNDDREKVLYNKKEKIVNEKIKKKIFYFLKEKQKNFILTNKKFFKFFSIFNNKQIF